MSHCPKCPGKLYPREVETKGTYRTESDIVEDLKTHGIDYIGEYPIVSPEEKYLIDLARYDLRIAEAKEKVAAGLIQDKKWDPVKYWNDLKAECILKEEQRLRELG